MADQTQAPTSLERTVRDLALSLNDHPDALRALVYGRRLLEFTPDGRARFPTIALYGDWAVHTSIDRNTTGRDALERVNALIYGGLASPPSPGKHERLVELVSDALSLAPLREEFVALLADRGVAEPAVTRSRDGWFRFVVHLAYEVSSVPIEFPRDILQAKTSRKDRQQYDRMRAVAPRNAQGVDVTIARLVLAPLPIQSVPEGRGEAPGVQWTWFASNLDDSVMFAGPLIAEDLDVLPDP